MVVVPWDVKIDQSIWRCFHRVIILSCLCDFCGCSYSCCLTRYISFGLCCVHTRKSFYSSKLLYRVLESVFRVFAWLHKGPKIFSVGLILVLNGTHDFLQDESRDSPKLFVTKSRKCTYLIEWSEYFEKPSLIRKSKEHDYLLDL